MSRLTYNGVTISYLSTKSVSYDDLMSEDNQDYIGTRVTISVTGYLLGASIGDVSQAPAAVAALFGNQVGAAAAAIAAAGAAVIGLVAGAPGKVARTFAQAQHELEQPRKELELVTDDYIITADATTDIRNGPFPEVTGIVEINGIEAIMISFRIVTYKYDCLDKATNFKPILISNRWSESESRDEQWLARRTRTGKVRILGGLGHASLDTPQIRSIVLPQLPNRYWVRDRLNYQLQSDGLAMDYTCEDREVVLIPLPPSIRSEMSLTDHTTWQGNIRTGMVNMTIKGVKPFVDANNLANIALAGLSTCFLALATKGFQRLDQGGLNVVGSELTIVTHYHTATLQITAKMRLKPLSDRQRVVTDKNVVPGFNFSLVGYKAFWPVSVTNTDIKYDGTFSPPGFPNESNTVVNGLSANAPMDNQLCDPTVPQIPEKGQIVNPGGRPKNNPKPPPEIQQPPPPPTPQPPPPPGLRVPLELLSDQQKVKQPQGFPAAPPVGP